MQGQGVDTHINHYKLSHGLIDLLPYHEMADPITNFCDIFHIVNFESAIKVDFNNMIFLASILQHQ